jgi:hypothetical protein
VYAVGNSDRDHSALALVPSAIFNLDRRALEDQGGEREIESSILQVRLALCLVPRSAA